MPEPYSREFAAVLEAELELIRARRREILREELARHAKVPQEEAQPRPESELAPLAPDADGRLTRVRLEALDEHLAGLAISGGGIRSATFAVGLLQGMASHGLLRRFDYLSTVSGGGYTGGWLAAWLKRDGNVANVERQLASDRVRQGQAFRAPLHLTRDGEYPTTQPFERGPVVDAEPEPIHHLRSYSSYLTPRLGLLSADTWTIILIWHRNVSVNFMMFLPLTMVVVFLARLLIRLYGALTSAAIRGSLHLQQLAVIPLALGLVILAWGFINVGRALGEFRREDGARPFPDEGATIYYRMVYPTLAAAVALSLGLRPVIRLIHDRVVRTTMSARSVSPDTLWDWIAVQVADHAKLLDWPNVVGHALLFGGAMLVGTFFTNLSSGTLWNRDRRRVRWKLFGCAGLAGAVGGSLLPVVENVMTTLSDAGRPELVAMLAAPALLLCTGASLISEVALLGRSSNEAEREWLSRFGALLLIGALLWIGVYATIVYVPILFLWVGLPLRMVIASGWLGTALAGAVAGRKARPTVPGGGGAGTLGLLAAVAPFVFMVGFLGLVSLGCGWLLDGQSVSFPSAGREGVAIDRYLRAVRGDVLNGIDLSVAKISLWMGLSALATLIGSHFIDVNLFSLNAMYANRLIRCYLGASRGKKTLWAERWGGQHDPRTLAGAPVATTDPARDANPVTGFDPKDDLDLLDLRIGLNNSEGATGRTYWGPHLLVNAALNLVGGDELAWRDRKGESFTMSPLYCGSKGTGYALASGTTRDQLTLGRAMSISGAAVDPNMRFYQSTSLTAFLTLLNARLGYWMQNPSGQDRQGGPGPWSATSPRYANLLLTEFLGRTDGKGDFVHLSDGGHFENLGVYELIRRRCRYIVVCDAGDDAGPSDDNLATLVRLARIDFGVRIELDTDPFQWEGPNNLAATHVVVGRVHYEDVDSGQMPGILVFIRIAMTGDEPSDVQQYAVANPAFPHETTDFRQSFTEAQFESYRALGDHTAQRVFRDARTKTAFWTEDDSHREFVRGNRRFFSSLQARWSTPPTSQQARTTEAVRSWIAFQREVRSDGALVGLAEDVFPELRSLRGQPVAAIPEASAVPDGLRAEMQAVGQALLLMEDVWFDLALAGRSDLPTNRGWMNGFRRWSGSEAFRRFWPVFRPVLSPDFARFLEAELHVAPTRPTGRRLTRFEPASRADEWFATLATEFDREWPRGDAKGRCLADLRAAALQTPFEGEPAVWLLFQSPSGRQVFDPLPEAGVPLPEGSFLVGVAGLVAEAPEVRELFVWVRRPHRASGLGNAVIGPLIQRVRDRLKADLKAAGGGTTTLRAYYPKSGREGDNDRERDRWMTFFALYDFRPESPQAPVNRAFSVATLAIRVPAPVPVTTPSQ